MIRTILYSIYFGIYTVIHFMVIVVLFIFTAPFDKKRSIIHYHSRIWAKMVFILAPGWKVRLNGLENIEKGKTYVAIINHQDMFDIPLMYHLPMHAKWVSKKEVYKTPVMGQVLLMHKDIAIDRKDPKSMSKLLKLGKENLDMGISILIFPEGTRSKTGRMGRFKEGAFLLAKKAGVGLLPIVVDGTKEALSGGKMSCPNNFEINILEPISAERVADTNSKDLAKQMQELMRDKHKQLRGELYQEL